MSSNYVAQAKRWETNTFIAEWLTLTVKHCTGEGKASFEKWALTSFPPDESRKMLAKCKEKPWDWDAEHQQLEQGCSLCQFDLGTTTEALKIYHQYAGVMDCCTPPRLLPAPRRKRMESSADWTVRRHEALLAGHKVPNVDFEVIRAIAISELDRVKDAMDTWRQDTDAFIPDLLSQGASTIPSPEHLKVAKTHHLGEDMFLKVIGMGDAFRLRNMTLQISHWCWFNAATFAEDLARRGLCTASSIQRACDGDDDLLWRFCAVSASAHLLRDIIWSRIRQVVTYCEHYRPYFKRWRDQVGVSHIDVNHEHWKRHTLQTELDCYIIEVMWNPNYDPIAFHEIFTKQLAKTPSDADKFSQEAFDLLGDLAVVIDFSSNLTFSPFGIHITSQAFARGADRMTSKMLQHAAPMSPRALGFTSTEYTPGRDRYGLINRLQREMHSRWVSVMHQNYVEDVLANGLNPLLDKMEGFHEWNFGRYDEMWKNVDRCLWQAAAKMDRPGESGRIAKEFNLLNPDGTARPSYLQSLTQAAARLAGMNNPPPEQFTPGPAASTREDMIPNFDVSTVTGTSGHSYATDGHPAKTKEKRRGTADTVAHAAVTESSEESGRESLDDYPDMLPSSYKLGKKVLKIFHNVLDPSPEEDKPGVPKRGQVRWADFERAMKRVGFDVIQTAGSSVRFDPPAKTARPISFHRPHPDSLLYPRLLKHVGARLRRTYGWTQATFELGAAQD